MGLSCFPLYPHYADKARFRREIRTKQVCMSVRFESGSLKAGIARMKILRLGAYRPSALSRLHELETSFHGIQNHCPYGVLRIERHVMAYRDVGE
jgi:hypothetical protein